MEPISCRGGREESESVFDGKMSNDDTTRRQDRFVSDSSRKGKNSRADLMHTTSNIAVALSLADWSSITDVRSSPPAAPQPPLEASLIASARAPVTEMRDGTFASHYSEWLKGY